VAGTGAPGLVMAWLRLRDDPLIQPDARAALGVAAVALAVIALGVHHGGALVFPVDGYWWNRVADHGGWDQLPISAPGFEALGWPEAGAARAELTVGDTTEFIADTDGQLIVALRGAVGLELRLYQKGSTLGVALVEQAPTEDPAEGPVRRYLDRGVGAAAIQVSPGPVAMGLYAPHGGAGERAQVYLLPGQDAVWSLNELGELRFVHYYQSLNIVENQVWAADTLTHLRATINQPPLWSYLLAVPTGLLDADMKGAAWIFLWVLVLTGVSGVRLLQLAGPRATWAAWLSPALATAVHGRLMIEPGSINFPDSLYAAALVGGMAALLARGGWRGGSMALAASLLRYPGAFVLLGAALLRAFTERRLKGLLRPALVTLGAAAGLVLLATAALALTGGLEEALEILWFETLPEHWHGEHDPGVLLRRAPRFYWMWVVYAGGAPLLAIVCARGRSLLILATAASYSLLLCTIDHFPTHYFLPLVHLSAIALAAGAGSFNQRLPGRVVLWLGLAGLCASALLGRSL